MMFLAGLLTGLVVAYIEYCILSKSTKDIKGELTEIKELLYYDCELRYDRENGKLVSIYKKIIKNITYRGDLKNE